MADDVTLRTARKPDLGVLAELNAGLIADEGSRNTMTLDQLRQRMARWLDSGAWRMNFFEIEGSIAGYATFRLESDSDSGRAERLNIRQFYILPAYRRHGLGRQALELLIERRGRPGTPVVLEVLESNVRGRAFWEAAGFKPYATTMERSGPV